MKRELIGTQGPLAGVRIPVDREETLVGRDPSCHLFLEEETVSRKHARILLERGKATVIDEGSRNGVFIAGKRVIRGGLECGVTVCFGRSCFVYWETEGQSPDLASPVLSRETEEMAEQEGIDLLDEPAAESLVDSLLLGSSPAMERVRRDILTMGPTPLGVLFVGDTGTGKELAAEACHMVSEVRSGPLVKVNCAAFNESLLLSELFGHEKGAFTGAEKRKPGTFELAHGGTLFLDEVGDMSPSTQAKILRVLQDGSFYRVGGTEPVFVRVRVMAATLRDLDDEVKQGTFREDLLYRLNAVTIRLPTLSERSQDIPILVDHLRELWQRDTGKEAPFFAEEAMAALKERSWPGNVRQLKNVVDRLCAVGGERVSADDVEGGLPKMSPRSTLSISKEAFSEAKDEFERGYLREALDRNAGNIKKTAEEIGVDRHNLAKKLRRLGIHPSQ